MLSTLHPLPKLVVCVLWIVTSILIFDLGFQLVTIALAAGALIVLERRSPLLVMALMVPFALFGFGFFTTSVLFRQDSTFALQMAAETPFGAPAFSAGLILFCRAIACGMVSALFALTTDPGALIKALMVHWRLPPSIGFALFQALNLVPDLGREMQQIRLARAMRKGRPPRRVPGPVELVSLIVPLLAYAIRRAGRSALAMEARGLSPARTRTVTNAPVPTGRDRLFVMICLCLLVAVIASALRPDRPLQEAAAATDIAHTGSRGPAAMIWRTSCSTVSMIDVTAATARSASPRMIPSARSRCSGKLFNPNALGLNGESADFSNASSSRASISTKKELPDAS